MAERYDVNVKVISQEGTCPNEHKVGEEWVFGARTPEGICLSAIKTILPSAQVLMFGGVFPWTPDPDATTVACQDAKNPVIFEIRRLRK